MAARSFGFPGNGTSGSGPHVEHPGIIQHACRRRRDPVGASFGIGAVEQIAQRTAVMRIHPSATAMLRRIMDHVASLAKRSQLFEATVARIVMQMGARQNYRCPLAHVKDIVGRTTNPPALPISPIPIRHIPGIGGHEWRDLAEYLPVNSEKRTRIAVDQAAPTGRQLATNLSRSRSNIQMAASAESGQSQVLNQATSIAW